MTSSFPKSPVVKMILESKDWKRALRFSEIRDDCSDADDSKEGIAYEQCSILQACLDPQVSNTACKETTPFRELIKEMPGLLWLFHIYRAAGSCLLLFPHRIG